MVYNFFFDVYLFDTHFTNMQYAGIIITMCTFIADCYMTASKEKEEESHKPELNQVAEQTDSQRANQQDVLDSLSNAQSSEMSTGKASEGLLSEKLQGKSKKEML